MTTENTSIEDKFKRPDGSIDIDAAQAHLQLLQVRSEDLSSDELREAIQLVRIIRRTNTGPAAARKKAAKAGVVNGEPPANVDLLDL